MFKKFIKSNIAFFVGMIFGSVVATTTTIMLTMGYFGVAETISMYRSTLCEGELK